MWLQTDNILEVEKLSKLFSRISKTSKSRVAGNFFRSLIGLSPRPVKTLRSGEFWPLKDVSFTLRRGEALGIIGLNGAGKTTLLRVLAGQLLPDAGEIRIVGRQAAMIDLTAGFQLSASGIRNIFLRGAMLGRTRQEIVDTFDDVIEFAELGDAIDAPVSTYSSGMLMRLAFSIMVATKPDILFIDEILSVGDFRFRQKCLSKIREMRNHAAIVLVSHSMANIKLFCDRAIVLNKGQMVFEGDPDEAISIYENMKFPEPDNKEAKRLEILKPQFHNSNVISEVKHHWTNGEGKHISKIGFGQTLYMEVSFVLHYKPKSLILGVPLWNEEGAYITGFSTPRQSEGISFSPNEKINFTLKVPHVALNPSEYISNLAIHDGLECLYRAANPILIVSEDSRDKWGIVTVDHEWYLSETD